MKSYKGRTVEKGQRVQVYRNLHVDCFSIKDKKSGKVLGHSDTVVLTDVKMVVQQGGRKRTVEMRKKAVHAWLEGDLFDTDCKVDLNDYPIGVYYDPYEVETFVNVDTNERIYEIEEAVLTDNRVHGRFYERGYNLFTL